MQASLKGNDEFVRVTEGLYRNKTATSADVDQAKSEREIVVGGLLDAEEALLKRKRSLGEILNLPPEQAERLEVRGTLADTAPPPPALAS